MSSRSSAAPGSTATPPIGKLREQRAELEPEIDRAGRKLANQGFVAKAPPKVVQAERDKLDAPERRATTPLRERSRWAPADA